MALHAIGIESTAFSPGWLAHAGLQRTSGRDALARRRPARYLLDAIHRAYQPRAQIYSISPSAAFHRPTAVHSLLPAASFH